MTEKNNFFLETLRDLYKEGEFERVREGLQEHLSANPDDVAALALQRHLDNLDVLEGIRHAVRAQDWGQVVARVEAALDMGLTWDIELSPLAALLENAKKRRAQAALSTLTTLPTMTQPDVLMEQLVNTILKKSRPQVAEAIRLAAVAFWFDLDLLSALRESDDGLDAKVLNRMARLSFVHQDDRGRYTFGQDVRDYLLDEWLDDPSGFVEANRRAQTHFLERLRAVFPDSDAIRALAKAGLAARLRPLVEAPPEVGELVQNYLYHTLGADVDAGLVLLRRLYRAAAEAHRPALAERYVEVAGEQRARLTPEQRAYLDYMRGLLDQLQEKWDASRDLFERMLQREGLPPTLQARIRRALGNTLIEQEQWVEAMALFDVALGAFQAADDELESALTMVNMGRAHLELALNTWGGGATFSLSRDWSTRLRDYIMLISRLPVALYMMSRLGVRSLLPVILRVGRDMDWPIARLFAIAADWFGRAETILRRLGDEDGLGQVEENLARLYLSLGHFKRAETICRLLLDPDQGISLSAYRAACARLDLAQALMHQGRLTEARELLERVSSVFAAYQHPVRIAQTHQALGQTFALEGQPGQAATHYQRAAQLYHQIDDLKTLTDVVEQMRLLQDLPQADEATRQSIETTASQITRRRYLTRFGLPLLHTFRLLALAGLAAALLFSLFTSLHVASGTDLSVNLAPEINWESVGADLEPILNFKLDPQLESSFDVDFSVYPIIIGMLLYLVLYTILGLWITVRTPLRRLQEGQSFDIMVDPHGVIRGAEGLPGSLKIKWQQVAAVLIADRCLLHRPIMTFSHFALFGEQGVLSIDWQTRHALAARDTILERLQAVRQDSQAIQPVQERAPTYQFGFSILHSNSGRLFIGTLVFILAFIITAQIVPQALADKWGALPYSLADLYSISYLGLLFPVGWWLAAQPLRERTFFKPESSRTWLVGLAGLLLAVFTLMDFVWLRLDIGRPNVAPGLLAAFMVGLATYYVLTTRHWEQIPFHRGRRVYSLPVRLLTAIVALGVIVLIVFFVGREIVIYHYLALGDYHRQRVASVVKDDLATQIYEKSLRAYDRALDAYTWGPETKESAHDADLHHSRGAVLVQLGRFDGAVRSYRKAIDLAPNMTAYYNSLAIAYELWAEERRDADDSENALKYYNLSHNQYSLLIERLDEDSDELATAYLLSGSVLYRLGELSSDMGNSKVAVENYKRALDDLSHALELQPDNTDLLVGLGWMTYKLAVPAKDVDQMQQALGYFEQVTAHDQQHTLAWIKQGQTHLDIAKLYGWQTETRFNSACSLTQNNPSTPEQKLAFKEELLEALDAFDQAVELDRDKLGPYFKRGYIRYLLFNCPGMDNDELSLDAIEDYTQAIRLEPDNPEWRLRRGNFYYLLGLDYYPQASADYEVALSLRPDVGLYLTLGNIYYAQDEMDDAVGAYIRAIETAAPDAVYGGYVGVVILDEVVQARPDWALAYYNRSQHQKDAAKVYDDLQRAAELDPGHYNSHWLLGWRTYENGDYQRSAEISGIAAALKPTEPRTHFNQGLALVALGDLSATRAYEAGIAAAEAMTRTETALARYDEALGDLDDVAADPAGIADVFRARLTFKQALAYVKSGATDQARLTYEAGIAITETLTNRETRLALYDEAIDDLTPEQQAQLVALLESARDN